MFVIPYIGPNLVLGSTVDDGPKTINTQTNQLKTVQPVDYTLEHRKGVLDEKQILLYTDFETRQNALEQISPDHISHVYTYIPAISVSSDTVIPNDGLQSINPVYQMEKTKDIVLENYISDAHTLNETANWVRADYLHNEYGLTGKGITIGILDSGIGESIKSFDSRIEYTAVDPLGTSSSDVYDQDGHGTHVSGIAAGDGKYFIDGKWRQTDSRGIAYDADVVSIRVLNERGVGDNDWVIQGIEKAINMSVDIISMSLSTALYEGPDDPMNLVVQEAINRGIIVVAAAGNTGPLGSAIGIPSALPNVISVGASVPNGDGWFETWTQSGVGPATKGYPGPDVVAPGVKIVSIDLNPDEGILALSGTSMATPHVSGGIALLLQAFPNATPFQIREAILAGALPVGVGSTFDPVESSGRGFLQLDRSYLVLNETVSDTESDVFMPVVPIRIQENNYEYRHSIMGTNKTLPVFIHSSRNISIVPHIRYFNSHNVKFELPDKIDINPGANRINVTIALNGTELEFLEAQIYFTEDVTDRLLPNANISYSALTTFPQTKILVDTSKDADTPSGYFGHNGPRGFFSQMSRYMEREGHYFSENTNANLTDSMLSDYDILFIADPDLEYSDSEIQAIHNFIQVQGKSLFVVAGGGILDAENRIFANFSRENLNSVLQPSGIYVPDAGDSQWSTSSCDLLDYSYEERIQNCLDTAETSSSQPVLPKNVQYQHYGPELAVNSSISASTYALAYDVSVSTSSDQELVAAASEIENGGRVVVISSPIQFDNNAMLYGYEGSDEALSNREIAESIISWLVDHRDVDVTYQIDRNQVSGSHTTLDMYNSYNIEFTPTDKDGNLIDLGPSFNVSILFTNIEESSGGITKIEAVQTESGSYTFQVAPSQHVTLNIYTPIKLAGNVPTNGHLTLTFNLYLYEQQDEFQNVARVLLFGIFISWIIWLINEGGRELKEKRKKELEI